MKNQFKKIFLSHSGKFSDKWTSYIEQYDDLLGRYYDQDINLLEIGIQNGGALEIFAKYFKNAKHIVGCDVDTDCEKLTFNDSRVTIFVGDINTDEVEEKIVKIAPYYDVIIDDGSHFASDTIKSFSRYFDKLSENGVYVIEDLHTSYWQEFEGGVHSPYSTMSFLKRLADITNFEHWRSTETRKKFLSEYQRQYGVIFDEFELCKIHSVTFFNSLCIIQKKSPPENKLGNRLIVGKHEVISKDYQRLNGTTIHDYSYSNADDSSFDIFNLLSEVDDLNNKLAEKDQTIVELKSENEKIFASIDKHKSEQKKEVKELHNQLRVKREKIEELINEIQQNKSLIQESNHAIDQLHQEINRYQSEVIEQSKLIENLEISIQQERDKADASASAHEHLKTRLQETTDLTQSYKNKLQILKRENAEKENEIMFYVLHPSWKITRLHRKILRLLHMLWKPRELIAYVMIKKSGIYDPEYYLRTNPDIRRKNIDPLRHFIKYGWKEGRNPSRTVDITQLILDHPNLVENDRNPILALIKASKTSQGESLSPSKQDPVTQSDYDLVEKSGQFSNKEHLLQTQDVQRADNDHLEHSLNINGHDGRKPSNLFNIKNQSELNLELNGIENIPLLHSVKNKHDLCPTARHLITHKRQFSHIDLGAYESRLDAIPFHCDKPPIKPDIIIFPIVDWEFRFQRPQHLAMQMAKAGHRVFYLTTHIRQSRGPFIRAIDDNIFLVTLSSEESPLDHFTKLSDDAIEGIEKSCRILQQALIINTGIMIVDQPIWAPLAIRLKEMMGWKLIYDCMDLHAGFNGYQTRIRSVEKRLIKSCDRVIVTSEYLREHIEQFNHQPVMIQNGTDFDFFHQAKNELKIDALESMQKPVLGYIGAIAEWFDTDLIAELAQTHPEWTFLLVGSTEGADTSLLEGLINVYIFGEKPYKILPIYLSYFDVCLIPFKKTPLTHATNPVKLYEYLSSGKPVVSTQLAETSQFNGLVELADTRSDWEAAIKRCLFEEKTTELLAQRYSFARNNTWKKRGKTLIKTLNGLFPKITIILVTHNQLLHTRKCLSSILENTSYPNYEIIIVDNGSMDGTVDYLKTKFITDTRVTVIENDRNMGLPKAINQATQQTMGEYLMFLNNDTVVTPGWLNRLLQHLCSDPRIGMVGPVTNAIGNEAKIEVGKLELEAINVFAAERANRYEGRTFEIDVLALYCCLISRELFNLVGGLDERYEIGMFEDDDLAMMVKKAGYKLLCAEDVFVYHFHGATFNNLPDEALKKIFNQNKHYYEEKWQLVWKPHQNR